MQVDVFPLLYVLGGVGRGAVAFTVASRQLLVDVSLDEEFKAVVALREQILQVPGPWLGMLKHTITSETSLPSHDTSVQTGEHDKRPFHTFMDVRSMSFFPGQH